MYVFANHRYAANLCFFLFCFMLSQCHAYGVVMVTYVRVGKIAHVHVCPQRHWYCCRAATESFIFLHSLPLIMINKDDDMIILCVESNGEQERQRKRKHTSKKPFTCCVYNFSCQWHSTDVDVETVGKRLCTANIINCRLFSDPFLQRTTDVNQKNQALP